MKTDRRTFIKTGALTLAGAAILDNSLFAAAEQQLQTLITFLDSD